MNQDIVNDNPEMGTPPFILWNNWMLGHPYLMNGLYQIHASRYRGPDISTRYEYAIANSSEEAIHKMKEKISLWEAERSEAEREVEQREAEQQEIKYHIDNQYEPIMKTIRQQILEDAIQCVTKDRNSTHGEPEDNFGVIADFWTTYLKCKGKLTKGITADEIATMMILMKVSRLITSPECRDHWVDIAGYAACGGGIACKGKGESRKEKGEMDRTAEMELPR